MHELQATRYVDAARLVALARSWRRGALAILLSTGLGLVSCAAFAGAMSHDLKDTDIGGAIEDQFLADSTVPFHRIP